MQEQDICLQEAQVMFLRYGGGGLLWRYLSYFIIIGTRNEYRIIAAAGLVGKSARRPNAVNVTKRET